MKIRKRIKSRKMKIRREKWKSRRNWGQLKVRRIRIRKKTGKSRKQIQEKNENLKEDKIKKNEDQERKVKIRKKLRTNKSENQEENEDKWN